VALLTDCNAPVVLRSNGAHFEFMGTCFVLGLMDGKDRDEVEAGEVDIEMTTPMNV
jgi:hypothetical protein